eukprot:712613-Prymnesium_polylepis.1
MATHSGCVCTRLCSAMWSSFVAPPVAQGSKYNGSIGFDVRSSGPAARDPLDSMFAHRVRRP